MNNINLEELYWADWEEISKDKEKLNEIFKYIKDYDSKSIEELSNILKLYNNPSGLFTEEFAKIISEIYARDKVVFIKALNLVKEEISNLVYVFRMEMIFTDEDKEFEPILGSNKLSQEEIETGKAFLKMYKAICATWI